MIMSPSEHEKQIYRQLLVYTKADYPYTPRRLFLYIIYKTGKIRQTSNVKKGEQLLRNASAGVRSSILITLVAGLVYAIKVLYIEKCNDCLPPNALLYNEVYLFSSYYSKNHFSTPIIFLTPLSFLTLVLLNSYIFALSSKLPDEILLIDVGAFRSIPASKFTQNTNYIDKNKTISQQILNRFYLVFSFKFWCKVYLIPLMVENPCLLCCKVILSLPIFLINIILVIIFSVVPIVNQMNNLFLIIFRKNCSFNICKPSKDKCTCSCLPIVLALLISGVSIFFFLEVNLIYIGMSCMVQFLIYFVFVGIPHLYSTQVRIFLLLTAVTTYMSKFFLDFFLLYRLLLQKVIQIKGTKEIEIKHFDVIVQHCFPVTREVFFLFAKVLMTSFLLIIMYLTLNELNFLDGENSFDLNTFLMYVFVLLTPGLLEILFFESNADKVERMHDELDEQVRNLENFYDSENENFSDVNLLDGTCLKRLCLCCCGCIESPWDENGHCKCCYALVENEPENDTRSFTITHVSLCDKRVSRHSEGYQEIV
jgi:hypothetical protein